MATAARTSQICIRNEQNNWEFKLRRLLPRKRHFKIELRVYSMLDNLYKLSEVFFRLLGTNGFHVKAKNKRFTAANWCCRQNLKRELTNPRLWLDDAVGFLDMPIAYVRKGTYRRRVKVDNVNDNKLPASKNNRTCG